MIVLIEDRRPDHPPLQGAGTRTAKAPVNCENTLTPVPLRRKERTV